jgi:hypothetical protein
MDVLPVEVVVAEVVAESPDEPVVAEGSSSSPQAASSMAPERPAPPAASIWRRLRRFVDEAWDLVS